MVSPVPAEQFNIHTGDEPTWNVAPILHEIRHALQTLLEGGETSIIDLRSIPLAPGEEQALIDMLGQGEVHARLDVLGPSEVYETRFSGVWLVTHYDESDSIISRFIEVTEIPAVLKSQREDIFHAVKALVTELGTDKTYIAETDT
jgi:hydrogenase-1 operon protein HyaF